MMLVMFLIFMLFLSFLDVDLSHIKSELKRPGQLFMQISWNFLLVPILVFFGFHWLGLDDFAIAGMLLAAMPAGMTGPVLTKIAGGRVATSAVLTVVTHILVPLSVPVLFWLIGGLDVQIDVQTLFQRMLLIIGVPVVLAAIFRNYFKKTIERTKSYYKLLSILVLAALAYFVIMPYSEIILDDAFFILPALLGTYVLCLIFALTSFGFSRKRKSKERAALIISRVYMNPALAIVLAFQFFGPEVTLITILYEVPWFTTFGLYLWFQKKFIF